MSGSGSDTPPHMDGNNGSQVKLPDAIIAERKAERKLKAEERRQLDLQRIKDMKSKTGIDPLQRFPKEIWTMLFENVGAEGRGSILQIHPMFRDLMYTHRIRDILLPQVLQLSEFKDMVVEDSGFQYDQLRLVSKSSRDSIDHGIEKKMVNSIRCLHSTDIAGVYSDIRNGNLTSLESELARYSCDLNPAKRYQQRYYAVNFPDIEMDANAANDFMAKHVELFQLIGDQIWVFLFNFDADEMYASEAYIILQQFVRLMPNLKWLQVSIRDHITQVIDLGAKSTLKRYPFPKLPSLERLSVPTSFQTGFLDSSQTIDVFKTVLEANPHLKMLDVKDDERLESLPRDLVKSLPLVNLRPCEMSRPFKFEKIKNMVNFNWQLVTLHLDIGGGGSSSMNAVIQFLEKFPTLEAVVLSIREDFSFEEDETIGYLKLPNLKELMINISNPKISFKGNAHFFFSLQFLLHCEKLNWLYWKMEIQPEDNCKLHKFLKNQEKTKENVTDFRAGLKDVFGSKIWDVFPSLDTVHVNVPEKTCWCCDKYPGSQVYYRGRNSQSKGGNSIAQFLKNHCTTV